MALYSHSLTGKKLTIKKFFLKKMDLIKKGKIVVLRQIGCWFFFLQRQCVTYVVMHFNGSLYDDFFCFYGYQLLKLVQKYGEIEKFDLLYHRTGPLAGKSRGYGFVTFKKDADAEKALGSLHNKLFGAKRLCVKKAQSMKQVGVFSF